MKRILHIVFLCMITVGYGVAQDRTITGKVTSAEDGSPIPGVNILLKGTAQGTVSDANGNFTLNAPASGGIAVFSFIGLITQEQEIGERAVIDVQMAQDVTELGEVIVTGYGDQEVRSITGSVSKVGSERINKIPLADVSKTLQGNIAGLLSTSGSGTPGSATQIRIRGIGSATASAEPLYIVDGIAIQTADLTTSTATANPIANINPNDIENVVVLKDAAATALYGSRASNGVVLITTKSGKAGQTKIDFHIQQGFSDQAYQKYERLNAEEYVMLRKEAYLNSGGNPANADAFAGSADINTKWDDVIFRTGKTNSYDVSAQGGNEKTTFFLSGGYFTQEGLTIATSFERLSARFNIDHKASDKLTIGVNMTPTYSKQKSTTAGSTFNSLILQSMLLAPNVPVKNEDGTYFGAFPGVLGESSPGANDGYNPVAITELDRRDNNTFRLIGKLYGSYKIIEGLSFRSDLSIDLFDGVEQIYNNSQFGDAVSVSGRATFDTQRNLIWQTTNILTYDKSINSVHNITGIGVFEALERSLTSSTLSSTTFANDELTNAVSGATPETASSTETLSSLVSYVLIGRYNYDKKYFISGSFRRDGSSRFGADVKYGNFWSVGASWMVTDEAFMQNLSFLNVLKLRTGFGTTGNESIGDFLSQGTFGPSAYNGRSALTPTRIANPELTWEKSEQFNVGIDFGIFGNRISGSIERYVRTTTDLIFNVPVSRTTGFNSVTTNAASLENSGWEITLNTTNLDLSGFRWTSNFNITFNKNEVLELGGGQKEVIDGTKKRTVGHDWSEYYLAEYAGVNPANGKPLWYDAEGNLVETYSASLRKMNGKSAMPDYFGGFTNTLSYKGIDLSFLFSFSMGAWIYDNFAFVYESNGAFMGENQKRTQLDRWQEPGDIARFPQRLNGTDQFAGAVHTNDLQDGSYIRFRNIQLGYTLPSNLLSKAKIRSCRVYVMGTNLATFSKFDGLDPEQLTTGVDSFNYPNPRTVSFGIDLGI